jgi:hypothetical protein
MARARARITTGSRRWTKWAAVAFVAAGCILLFALPSVLAADVTCPTYTPPTSQPVLGEGVAPVPLILDAPEGVIIELGRERNPQVMLFSLSVGKKKLQKGQTEFATLPEDSEFVISTRPLKRDELYGSIAPELYVAVANVTVPNKEITLTICIDPAEARPDAGTYVGSIKLRNPAIEDLAVPVTVRVQNLAYPAIAIWFGLITVIAGTFFVWASGKREKDQHIWREPGEESVVRQIVKWAFRNYAGVGAGAIAAITVFVAKYWRDPAWGAKAPEDWFALLGALFTAYTATLTTAAAVGLRPKPKEEENLAQPDPAAAVAP